MLYGRYKVLGSVWEKLYSTTSFKEMQILHQVLISVGAGIPNITGSFGRFYTNAGTFSGAFYSDGSTGTGHGGSNQSNSNVYMNAARVSGIYGASSSVTPLSRKCKYFIKYSG